MGADNGVGPDFSTGQDTGINTGFGVIADYGADLIQSGIYFSVGNLYRYVLFVEAEVCQYRASAKGAVSADYGIADVVRMEPAAVANVGILNLGAMADDAIGADMAVVTYQGVVADNSIRADISRTPYHRIFHHLGVITYYHLAFYGGFF